MDRPKTQAPPAPWYIRLAYSLGFKPGSKEWRGVRNSHSKHARQKTRPEAYRARRLAKRRRHQADQSRKINRRK